MTRISSHKRLSSGVIVTAVAAAGMLLTADAAKASLLVYEPFDYASGQSLHGLNGGTGFAAPWLSTSANAVTNNAQILSGSYSYTDGSANTLLTGGNRAFLTGYGIDLGGTAGSVSIVRNLAYQFGSLDDVNGLPSTTWISFLSLVTAPPFTDPGYSDARGSIYYGRAQALQTHQGSNSERLTIGRVSQNGEATTVVPTDTWALANRGSGAYSTPSTVSLTNVPALSTADLIIVRIDHVPGDNIGSFADTAYMWVNPTDLTVIPDISTAAVTNFAANGERDYNFDYLRLFAGGTNGTVGSAEIQFDEIRIGDDYLSVVPLVPEPAVACLLGFAGLGLWFGVKRKRQD